MARAPTPLIVRLPLQLLAGADVDVLRWWVGGTYAIPEAWLGGDVEIRIVNPDPAQVAPDAVDVFLTLDELATVDATLLPSEELPEMASASLGVRVFAGDEPRRFWVPRLEEIPVASPPAALYLATGGSRDGLVLEIAIA